MHTILNDKIIEPTNFLVAEDFGILFNFTRPQNGQIYKIKELQNQYLSISCTFQSNQDKPRSSITYQWSNV